MIADDLNDYLGDASTWSRFMIALGVLLVAVFGGVTQFVTEFAAEPNRSAFGFGLLSILLFVHVFLYLSHVVATSYEPLPETVNDAESEHSARDSYRSRVARCPAI